MYTGRRRQYPDAHCAKGSRKPGHAGGNRQGVGGCRGGDRVRDFNCPYGYLASQRVDLLKQLGKAELDWRAVEHDPGLSLTGTWAEADRERWER